MKQKKQVSKSAAGAPFEIFSRWILSETTHLSNFPAFYNSFVQLLNSFGLQLIRFNVGVRTFHPQIEAFAYIWSDFDYFHQPGVSNVLHNEYFNFKDAVVIQSGFNRGMTGSSQFNKSPIPRVVMRKETYRFRFTPDDAARPKDEFEYGILADLAPLGATDYLALPFSYNEGESGFSSLVSLKPGGLSDDDIELVNEAISFFRLKFESHMQHVIKTNLLTLYVGGKAGQRVLDGQVELGDVETIKSVIWFSDLRGYTRMMATHDARTIVDWLNGYFEALISSIHRYDGEVLKFMGDGLLAIFPVEDAHLAKARQMRYKALLCARSANRLLGELNRRRSADNLPVLKHGIALHYGDVEYGNIGAPTRLDFTVVGPAVNRASRMAGLCERLDSPIILSEELASHLRVGTAPLGEHHLKGIDEPAKLFRLDA